jgi:hypothetical protein
MARYICDWASPFWGEEVLLEHIIQLGEGYPAKVEIKGIASCNDSSQETESNKCPGEGGYYNTNRTQP